MKICKNPNCGKVVANPDNAYCSRECYQSERFERAWQAVPKEKKCPECGELFYPRENEWPSSWARRETCSKSCGALHGAKGKDVAEITSIAPHVIRDADEIRRAERLYAESAVDYSGIKERGATR